MQEGVVVALQALRGSLIVAHEVAAVHPGHLVFVGDVGHARLAHALAHVINLALGVGSIVDLPHPGQIVVQGRKLAQKANRVCCQPQRGVPALSDDRRNRAHSARCARSAAAGGDEVAAVGQGVFAGLLGDQLAHDLAVNVAQVFGDE